MNISELTQAQIDDINDKYSEYYYLIRKAHHALDELIRKYRLTHEELRTIFDERENTASAS